MATSSNDRIPGVLIHVILLACFLSTSTGNVANYMPVGRDDFARCWKEATYPMEVALGTFSHYSYICSSNYYTYCNTSLPQSLTHIAGLQPHEISFVMSTFLTWINGGGKYLCNKGFDAIQDIMERGGKICIEEFTANEIAICNENLALLRSGYMYSNEYCKNLDTDLHCYITAIALCENKRLNDFLWNFFKSVMWSSPCRDVSRFTNSATTSFSNLSVMVAIFCTYFSLQ